MVAGISQDVAVATVAAAASLIASAAYVKARADTNKSTIETLTTNVQAVEAARRLDTEAHERTVAQMHRELEDVRREGRVVQHEAVERISVLVAERIARQTQDVLLEIRNELRGIRVLLRLLRRALGTRGDDRDPALDDDDELED